MTRRVIASSAPLDSKYIKLELFELHALFAACTEQANEMLGDIIGSAEVESWTEVTSLKEDLRSCIANQTELMNLILNACQEPK